MGRVGCAVDSRVSGAGNAVRERRDGRLFQHPAYDSEIQQFI